MSHARKRKRQLTVLGLLRDGLVVGDYGEFRANRTLLTIPLPDNEEWFIGKLVLTKKLRTKRCAKHGT